MIIKRDKEDFQKLSLDILDGCPSNESDEFIEGFLEFVDKIFDDLDALSDIFWNYPDDTCEIDFKFLFDEATKAINQESRSHEFLKGAKLAEKETLEAMIFAFKWEPKHQAA